MKFSQLFIIFISVSCCCPSTFSQSWAVISGKIIHARKDSLSFIYGAEGKGGKTVKAPRINDSFYLKLELGEPYNIDITDGVEFISGLIEPTDNIIINADFGNKKIPIEFEGKGKGKFVYLTQRTPLFPALNQKFAIAKLQKNPLDYLLDVVDSTEKSYIRDLNLYKTDMSQGAWLIFMGDIKGYLFQIRSAIPSMLYNEPTASLIKRNSDSISIKFKQQYKSFLNFDESYSHSSIYDLTVAGVMESEYKSNYPDRLHDIAYKYKYITKRLPTKLQVPVINRLLWDDIKTRQDKEALEKVISETFRREVDSSDKANLLKTLHDIFLLKEGGLAPDFSLENVKGGKVRLSDFKGKIVYMDFWFAECAPCQQLFKQLKPVKEYFKNDTTVVFLTISIDNKEVWETSISKFNIDGYHVYTEGKEAAHPIVSDYQVFGYPTNRLLDKEGKFFVVAPSDKPEELIKEINAALKK